MKAKIQNLKKDIYNVFVLGNADNMQQARVYFLITVPMLTLFFALSHIS